MIRFIVNEKSLIINGKSIDFPYKIDNVKVCMGILIVLLDIPSKKSFKNNIFGVNHEGIILWQVEDAGEIYSFKNDVPYVGSRVSENNQLVITNFNGVTFTINALNGKILGNGITK